MESLEDQVLSGYSAFSHTNLQSTATQESHAVGTVAIDQADLDFDTESSPRATTLDARESVIAEGPILAVPAPGIPGVSPQNPSRSQSARYVRIGILVFAVALALVMISPSMVHTAHASTATTATPPYSSIGACWGFCGFVEPNTTASCPAGTTAHCAYELQNPAYCANGVTCVTVYIYSASTNNDGWMSEEVSTDLSPCPNSPSFTGTCPNGQGYVTTNNTGTLYVYADVYFKGNMTGSGTSSTGFGTTFVELDWAVYGESKCTVQCGSLFYFTYLTHVSDRCSVQGDRVGSPFLCTSPYIPPGSTGYCNATTQVKCTMASGNILRDFDAVSVPSSWGCCSFNPPVYIVTLNIQLWTESTNGSGGYAYNDFWSAGYFQIYDFGVINPSVPNAPTLTFPANNGVASSPVDFQWNPVYDPSGINNYYIQIDTSPSFPNPTSSYVSGSSTDFKSSLTQGIWYWRLQETVGGYVPFLGPPGLTVPLETSAWTSVNQFIVDNSPPSRVTLTGPANGTITNNNKPTISWNAATDYGSPPSGVAGYVIEWDTSTAFSTSDPNFHYYPPFPYVYVPTSGTLTLSDGTWYWRVEAVDNAGNVGPWSTAWWFMVDTSPPSTPALQSPSNGAVSTATTQTFSWSASTDDSGIASYNLRIDTSTSFNSPNMASVNGITGTSYGVTLRPGLWYWEVQAVDRAGNTGAWSSYFTLNIADFTFSATPSSLSTTTGTPATWTVTVGSLYGFSGSVTLSDILPTGLTCSAFSPPSVSPSPATTPVIATISCSSNTAGSYQATLKGTSGSLQHSSTVAFQATGSLSLSASPSQVPSDGSSTSTITVKTSDNQANVLITLSTNFGTLSATSCTTGTGGSCAITITSSSAGVSTLTATSTYYTTGSTAVTFAAISLTSNPSAVSADGSTNSTLTAQLSTNTQGITISFSTNGPTLSATTCSTGSTGSCSVTIRSSQAGVFVIVATSPSYAAGSTSVDFFDFSMTTSPLSLDGYAKASCSSSSSQCVTSLTTTHPNDVVIVYTFEAVDSQSTTCGFFVHDNRGLTWNLRASISGRYDGFTSNNRDQIAEFWAKSPTTLSYDTITENIVGCGNNANGLEAFAINGANTNSPFDPNSQVPQAVASSGGVPSTSISTTNSNDMIIGAALETYLQGCGGVLFPGNGYGLIAQIGTLNFCNTAQYGGGGTAYVENGFATAPQTGLIVNFNGSPGQWWEQIVDAITPGQSSVIVGVTKTSSIVIEGLNHSTGTVSLTDTVPPNLTCGPITPSSFAVQTIFQFTPTITCSSNTAGTYSVAVTGTSGTLSHSVNIQVNVEDFSISASPATVTVFAGSSSPTTISVSSLNGFSGILSLTPSVNATGLTVSCSPSSLTLSAGATSISTCTLSGSTAGNYAVNVVAASGSLSHSITVKIYIQDFTIYASPTSLTIVQGASGTSTLYFTSVGGFSGSVYICTSAPSGIGSTVGSSTLSLSAGQTLTGTLSMSAPSSTVPGTYSVAVWANPSQAQACQTHNVNINLSVISPSSPNFSLSVSPTPMSIPQGNTQLGSLVISSLQGFSGVVYFSSYTPTGISAGYPSNLALTAGGSNGSSTNLQVVVSSTMPTGTYFMTITGTSNNPSVTHTVSISVTVTSSSGGGGGGGGSLAHGTLITMANGSEIPVQNLKVGDQMLGYDPTISQFVVSTVTSIKVVDATTMLVINTGTGTPLRVDASATEVLWTKLSNGTALWLPVTQLKVGDDLWTPRGWVPVISIAFAPTGHHIMYDVTATAPYFANGYLDPPLPS